MCLKMVDGLSASCPGLRELDITGCAVASKEGLNKFDRNWCGVSKELIAAAIEKKEVRKRCLRR